MKPCETKCDECGYDGVFCNRQDQEEQNEENKKENGMGMKDEVRMAMENAGMRMEMPEESKEAVRKNGFEESAKRMLYGLIDLMAVIAMAGGSRERMEITLMAAAKALQRMHEVATEAEMEVLKRENENLRNIIGEM